MAPDNINFDQRLIPWFWILSLALVLLSSPRLATCEMQEYSLIHDGVQRKYYLHFPNDIQEKKNLPVVVNFHGGGGGPIGHSDLTGMNLTADKHGFLIVYPQGNGKNDKRKRLRFWNVGLGPDGPFHDLPVLARADDIGFIRKLLQELSKRFQVDQKRIYATGFSNGGMLTQRLVCEMGEELAAIASVAGPFWNVSSTCHPKRMVPVLYVHGTADKCAPYRGGRSECGWLKTDRVFISAEQTVRVWRDKDRCRGEGTVTYQNGDATCRRYAPCAGGADVVFCSITGGGHTWPGGKAYQLPLVDVGKTSDSLDVNELMWEFFKRYQLPVTPEPTS